MKKEVYLNQWLEDRGYLQLEGDNPHSVGDMAAGTKAYSLIPGRIFLNLAGREQKGSVESGSQAESLKTEITEALLNLTDPDDGSRIIERVLKREDLYSGPYLEEAADLIAIPYDGYDLKANVRKPAITFKGDLVGMHTYNDASLFIKDQQVTAQDFSILDLAPTVLNMMELEPDSALEGRSLV